MSGIQGLPLEVTVVSCYNLDDKEWISRQDPYVCLEYGGVKFRTKTCTDGGTNPTFQEKFNFTLIEGLRELNIWVWNSNTFSADDFIGSGRIQLHKTLSQGHDNSTWSLQSKSGRNSGEVRLILHAPKMQKLNKTKSCPNATPCMTHAAPPPPPQQYQYATTSSSCCPSPNYNYTNTTFYPSPSPSPSPHHHHHPTTHPPYAYAPPPPPQPYPPPPPPPSQPPPYYYPYPPGPHAGLYPPSAPY